MIVENSGWSEDRGWFCDKYSVDTYKTDMVIKWSNGKESNQAFPFENINRDWNYDNDVYDMYGAYFEDSSGSRDFYTPEYLVDLIIENKATVDGIRRI